MLTERQSKGCFCARLLEKISQIAEVEAERDMWKARYYQAVAERGKAVRDAAYDTPCEDMGQQCCAHVMRRFERLLKKEPENREYRAFVPKMCGLLSEAMGLRPKGLSPEDFAREAKRIRQKIEEMMDEQARDPALQGLQSWMRERRGELFRWTESPDIPAENNRAERGVRGLCIARKTSFGGQSEDALWVRGANQSVLESLAFRYDDPSAVLAEALTRRSAHVAKPPPAFH